MIGALVNGLMGIEPLAPEGTVATLSRLTEKISWAEVQRLPILRNVIDVRHDKRNETVLSNRSGASLDWVAKFYGRSNRLWVDGEWIEAARGSDQAGNELAWVKVTVAPGKSRTVRKIASE